MKQVVYFWQPHTAHGFLGQWYPSSFVETSEDGTTIEYANAEQYMMYQKGLLFAPASDVTQAILDSTDPKEMRSLGRLIPNFDPQVWEQHRENIVFRGTMHKFTQNPELKEQLLATGDAQLVEASPFDNIWGIGFGVKQAPVNRSQWGLNLLGQALMAARQQLRSGVASAG